MSAHLGSALLSAYLDEEVAERDAQRVEGHLSECLRCQQRLDGLRRVVAKLHRVPTANLPYFLQSQTPQRISLQQKPERLFDRLDGQLRRLHWPESSIPVTFALVMVLAMTVYFFTWAVHRQRQPGTSILVAPGGLEATTESVELGGLIFTLRNGVWYQRSLGEVSSGRWIGLSSADGKEILASEPGLGELLERSDGVHLWWRGEPVLLIREEGLEEPLSEIGGGDR